MNLTVENLSEQDRTEWQSLYYGYVEFYQVAMNDDILETVWGWIHDDRKRGDRASSRRSTTRSSDSPNERVGRSYAGLPPRTITGVGPCTTVCPTRRPG
jgi:hypothetical protein